MNRSTLRSIGAVIAGALVGILLSIGSDAAMRGMGYFTQEGRATSDGPFVVATIYRAVYGAAGAYLTARLAPSRPLIHALVLGFLGLLAGMAGAAAMWQRLPELGPKWYAVALVIISLPVAWVGGTLRLVELRKRA